MATQDQLDQFDIALRAIEQARVRERDAHAMHLEAGARASALVSQMGRSGSGVSPQDKAFIQRIYWEYPEITVDSLAACFGLRQGQLRAYIEPIVETRQCLNFTKCGEFVDVTRHSRAELGSGKQRCDKCVADYGREERVRWADERAEERLRAGEVNRLHQSGVEPKRVFVEYEGVHGTWLVQGDPDILGNRES